MKDLGRKMAKGAAWMVLFKLLERSLGLVTTLVLARLLVPEDFGIVAMATSVIAILDLLTGFSFDVALIQKQDAERRHYDTAWTLNIVAYAAMAALMVALAAPVATYYREPRVESVLCILAIGIFAVGFENIGTVAFRKDLQLNKEFGFLLAKKLVAAIVGIVIAVTFRTYWALVAGMVTSRVIGVALSYMVHPFRPRLSLTGARELLHFSKWLFLNGVLVSLITRVPDFVIGRVVGAASLGVYNLAHELANLPTTELSAPINRAVFPGYAKMAHDPGYLRSGFLAVLSVIALISVPAAVGIAAAAEPLVRVLLGEKWLAAVPIIEILALSGLLGVMRGNAWHLFLASARASVSVYLGLFQLAIFLPALIVGVNQRGVEGAAWATLGTSVVMFVASYAAVSRIYGAIWGELTRLIWRSLAGATAMYFAVRAWLDWLDPAMAIRPQIVALLSAVLIGAVVYVAAVYLLWRMGGSPKGPESRVIDMATVKLRDTAANWNGLGRNAR